MSTVFSPLFQEDSGSSIGTPLSTPRHSRVPSVSVGAPTPDALSPSSSPQKSISINVALEDQEGLQPSHHSELQLTPTGPSGLGRTCVTIMLCAAGF